MRLNVFRNPFIDAQVSMLIGTLDDARRRETEAYWRTTIAQEILQLLDSDIVQKNIYEHGRLLCPECGVQAQSWIDIALMTAAQEIRHDV